MHELGKTSLLTAKLLGDVVVVLGVALVALGLAASTLRRQTGDRTPAERRRLLVAPAVALVVGATLVIGYAVNSYLYVTTDNAQTDSDRYQIVAPADGVVVGWQAPAGRRLHGHQVVGHIEMLGSFGRPRKILRAPSDGTVVVANVVDGAYVTRGTRLAEAFTSDELYVTARIRESDVDGVRLGSPVDVTVDAAPGQTFTGYVTEINGATAATVTGRLPDNGTANFARPEQLIPVRIAIGRPDPALNLVPGLNTTVRIHRR
jgi:multidrug resistance efflux pump